MRIMGAGYFKLDEHRGWWLQNGKRPRKNIPQG